MKKPSISQQELFLSFGIYQVIAFEVTKKSSCLAKSLQVKSCQFPLNTGDYEPLTVYAYKAELKVP